MDKDDVKLKLLVERLAQLSKKQQYFEEKLLQVEKSLREKKE